jgi:hypothetical protein
VEFQQLATFFDKLKIFLLAEENRSLVLAIVVGLIVLLVLFFLWRLYRRRRTTGLPLTAELRIDLSSLIQEGPPAEPPILEFYNLPVRLSAIVLAPVGRLRELPSPEEFPEVFESALPGLGRVFAEQRPLVRCWPGQVSTRGFAAAFFGSIRLPGDCGKGTSWSAVAGIFKHEGTPIMLGLILRAASPNSIGQITIHTEHEWLGCLRVKTSRD